MLVPKYWAEAREQYKTPAGQKPRRQVTLRRLGWSDTSQEDAQRHAEQRVHEAMQEVLSGQVEAPDIQRRERKFAYNGADGLPIREEVVHKQGENVITRNAYGALCLNTPDVMFIDVDIEEKRPVFGCLFSLALFMVLWVTVAATLIFFWKKSVMGSISLGFLAGMFITFFLLDMIERIAQSILFSGNKPEQRALARIEALAQTHPDWLFNVYRTSAGYRLLMLHRTFDPADEAIWQQIETALPDPMYVRMCRLQNCFRARLTPKPWRAGIRLHIEPQRRIWDISQAGLPARLSWIEKYEDTTQNYATCHFVKQYGKGFTDPKAEQVRALHDDWCKVHSQLPLA